ncbi:hypothetical protein D6783_06055, partial [Candidatus Woesearchaeota archaeon]
MMHQRITMERVLAVMNFTSLFEFLVKVALPVLSASLLSFLVLLVLSFPVWVLALPILGGFGFLFCYPLVRYFAKKNDIESNLHLFITYAGTISTMRINRSVLFRRIASKEVFGEISRIAEKIHYLAKKWSLGFSKTCRKVGNLIPSQAFADFLDRFAVAMDFGQDIEKFLLEEQDAVMDVYELEYKKSLEHIKLIQNLFISLTISTAFMLSISLLLPILMGISFFDVSGGFSKVSKRDCLLM